MMAILGARGVCKEINNGMTVSDFMEPATSFDEIFTWIFLQIRHYKKQIQIFNHVTNQSVLRIVWRAPVGWFDGQYSDMQTHLGPISY